MPWGCPECHICWTVLQFRGAILARLQNRNPDRFIEGILFDLYWNLFNNERIYRDFVRELKPVSVPGFEVIFRNGMLEEFRFGHFDSVI